MPISNKRVFEKNFNPRVKGKMYRPVRPEKMDLDMMIHGRNGYRKVTTGCFGDPLGMTCVSILNQQTPGPKSGKRREFKRYARNRKPSTADLHRDAKGLTHITEAYKEAVLLQKFNVVTEITVARLRELCRDWMGSQFAEFDRHVNARAASIYGRGFTVLDGKKLRRAKAMIATVIGENPYSGEVIAKGKKQNPQPQPKQSTSYYVG